MRRVLTIGFTAFAILASFSAFGKKLTKKERQELFESGTITIFNDAGKKVGHYEAHFMPGTKAIAADAKEALQGAAALMAEIIHNEDNFYEKKVLRGFKDGVNYVKDGVNDGLFRIDDDFRETREGNRKLRGFGSKAGKLGNWLKFGVSAVARVASTVWHVGAGTVYAVAAPTAHIVYRPVAAGTQAIVAGALWPSFSYAWNGVAWVASKNSDRPSPEDNSILITFVPERI